MVNEPSKWDEATYGPMSLESIRRLFQPESRCHVGWNRYPAGATFNGWSRAGRRYIISGGCRIESGEQTWELLAGEFLDVPEGDYHFSVCEESPVELVSVWELPESLRQSPEDA